MIYLILIMLSVLLMFKVITEDGGKLNLMLLLFDFWLSFIIYLKYFVKI